MRMTLFLAISSLLVTTVASATEYSCDKKYCKQMSSCDEAYYKLKVCDHIQLDKDGDGVPCESVCGKGGKKQSKKSKQDIKKQLDEAKEEISEAPEKTNN